MAKCEIAKNVEIRGEKIKVVNPTDNCGAIQKVLAKHEGSKMISPAEYKALLNKND